MSRARILIVDDEPDLAGFIGEILQSHGYDVDVCANGRQALLFLQDQEYQCIVTDLKMPEMGGRELCGWIRENRENLPVITMSGYDDAENNADSGSDVIIHLSKPFSIAILLDALSNSTDLRKAG